LSDYFDVVLFVDAMDISAAPVLVNIVQANTRNRVPITSMDAVLYYHYWC
jgi:hypothetical protein